MFAHYLEALLFRTLFCAINLFSLSTARRIGRSLGLINFYVVKFRCGVVKKQLKAAFPDKSEKEIRNLVREINISYGYTAVEFCWFSPKKYDDIKNHIVIRGKENLIEALSHKHGCILFSGHFGNWELAAQLVGNLAKNTYAVARRQKNIYFNDFVNAMRESNFVHLIPMKVALRGIIKALRDNKLIFMLGDQKAKKKTGVMVNFFSMPTYSNPGTAKISLKFNVPVIFAVCFRKKNGSYTFHLDKPMYPKITSTFDQAVIDYTQLLTSKLESWIKKYPEQWFWFHRRWKTGQGLLPKDVL